mmetsp:Transcript_34408/g.48039  ORF Transcript_34408/g.48039 Transcript_34408/m.48039 type:complete len:120 (-) Transcript_34408:176-535(-)
MNKISSFLYALEEKEDLVSGLKRMAKEHGDNYLIREDDGNCGFCTRYTIQQGEIGVGTYAGRTHFMPPGNYFRLWFREILNSIVELTDESKAGTFLEHIDISYVSLPENHVAVVQVDEY